MSAYTATHAESEWHSQRTKPGEPTDGTMGLQYSEVSGLSLDAQKRPTLRTHKSFPYTLSQPHHSASQQLAQPDHQIASPQPQRERITISNLEESQQTSLPNVTYGGSAPASPVSRLTPPSPEGEKGNKDDDHNDALLSGSNDEGDDSKPMTAAELRAQKRKMKRFRRAKLKRLTSDDRERMMRSRALPDDFDMTQALHSPFGAAGHGVGTPLASPAANFSPSFPEGNMVRPLSLDTIRRFPEGQQMSPGGIPPPFGGYSFTPPQSATDTSSPVSATGEPNPFAYSQSMDSSPRRPNPFVGPPHSAHYQQSRTPGPANPQSATFPNYQSSPLATPGAYNPAPLMSAPHNVSTFSNSPSYNSSYGQAQGGQSEQYQMGPVLGEVEGSTQQNENNETGVQMPHQY
ncbi:hypothetical protein SLS56_003349 [Neofusicoccum ribis]|uniref:BZIP domain-containing protein n=1 Tax=Neofusicoccum ribis TaxID=45134 RepID=A0ABR3SZW0_9PEZI